MRMNITVKFFTLFITLIILGNHARADWFVRIDGEADRQALEKAGMRVVRTYRHFPFVVVKGTPAVEKSFAVSPLATRLRAVRDGTMRLNMLPNDPAFYEWQGALNLAAANPSTEPADMHWIDAWDIRTDASPIVVAVVDSGINFNHPDLVGNLWSNTLEADGQPGVDDDGNGFIDDILGWNVNQNRADVSDSLLHGTQVAGIIGAVGDNGIGMTGVCWNVRLMPVKIFEVAEAADSIVIAGLDYVLNFPEVRVINASFSSTAADEAPEKIALMREIVDRVEDYGILIVAAAGNENINIDVHPRYPAMFYNVLSVAATDRNGLRASFSNFGQRVSIAARGVAIHTTYGGGYTNSAQGTSFSCPFAAGLAALVFAEFPGMTPAQVRRLIIDTSRPTDALEGVPLEGGLLDAPTTLEGIKSTRMWPLYE